MLKLFENTQFGNLINDVNNGINVTAFGVNEGEKGVICANIKKPLIFVAPSMNVSQKIQKQLENLNFNARCINFISKECTFKSFEKNEVDEIFYDALFGFSTGDIDALIITPEVLLKKLPSKEILRKNTIEIVKDEILEQNDLIKKLIKLGYKRQSQVLEKGDFTVRGDIVDIFPRNQHLPVRISFFDDTIETIKTFNVETYMTIEDISKVVVSPCSYIFLESGDVPKIINSLQEDNKKTKNDQDTLVRQNNLVEKVTTALENGGGNCNFIVPYLDLYNQNILAYAENGTVVFDEIKQINDILRKSYEEYETYVKDFIKNGELLNSHKNFFIQKEDLFKYEFFNKLAFININSTNNIFKTEKVYSFECSPCVSFDGNYDLLLDEIEYNLERKYLCVIFAENATMALNINEYLSKKEIPTKLIQTYSQAEKKFANIITQKLHKGINLVKEKIYFVASDDIVKTRVNQKSITTRKNVVFTMPKVGDWVVHTVHGVGICDGFQKMKVGESERDYVVIRYKNDDKYFLPTERIYELSSYIANGAPPKLNKLGSGEFEKEKAKVKDSIKKMAFSLINLYAERKISKAFRYEIDKLLYDSFCSGFAFEETEDQLQAIAEIERDMTSDKIMDRLICGDVGFGKTEVAMRAIFIAIMNGKQVAFLCPTTVLSQQHYSTCKTRMQPYMVNVEMLNRFKSTKEQTKILKDLSEGKIDVICGTHRLLSKDVNFKDLGLLVLDEEQKFGVEAKEKLKNLKKNIDVLTLSATPIPRTLHIGLTGIRDISIIATPPKNRLPVQTVVTEFNESLLCEAVNRELKRDGQVLIIYNRVETIIQFVTYIRNLFPEANVDFAHGQMAEKELFTAIKNLYEHNTDILVSTTLIENGVDLPTANTIFVIDSDYFGLSELYQLKGRVGRSNVLAYAYFTYAKNKALSEQSYKRLSAITEFSSLGSGFKIAMKDLEIRGAGNILGKEQHGQIARVGYDMYCKLLNEAIKELRGEKVSTNKEVKIIADVSAFVPKNYVSDNEDRFRIYNTIASISSSEEREKICDRIKDIYKYLPQEIENLTRIALIQNLASQLNIVRINVTKKDCYLVFDSLENALTSKIGYAMKESEFMAVYNFKDLPIINFETNNVNVVEKLDFIIKFLNFAMKFCE